MRGDGVGEFHGRGVTAAERAVGADEIRVAELACRIGAVGLAAAPEVAAGKTAEHGCAPGMGAFALQGQEDFLDRVTHWSLLKLSIVRVPDLPERFACGHRRGHGDIERPQPRADRDHQPRIRGLDHRVGDAGALAPE